MAQSEMNTKSTSNKGPNSTPGSSQKQGATASAKSAQPGKGGGMRKLDSDMPSWLAPVMSVLGVGVAVGAGLYATRHQWLPKTGARKDDFAAAFADNETDYENFDQTRQAGTDSMRDDQADDWNDIDDMSDASFPASDPPSFTPGTVS
jgi:hypothetical protein